MLRDFKFLKRNSSKNEEIENVPVNPRDSLGSQSNASTDLSRPPLNSLNPKLDKTPTKPIKPKNSDHALPLRTPDRYGVGKNRFGWANKGESCGELRDDLRNLTPRVGNKAAAGKASSGYSESNSTQSTPTKSVSKPPSVGFKSKFDLNGNGCSRGGNFAALYKGIPSSSGPTTVVNTVEVPHFDLKEDPSFWMDHNVQVLIRVRPLNSIEKSMHGYNRCLKQESAQSITWIGQPETRFTFDHVACETVDQEMLFRMAGLPMVENCLSGYNSCMFAYGQTGSGKTYTMLGDIEDLEVRPSPHRGMTPRIFEFLFARIQAEEESRRDEKLKYNCKCSFLEIYNEQITDLLDPSSTNLQLREDVKKGVYVENLSEIEVRTVGDILKLLTQGSLNRKVAATNMNRESSRSHSVFTCVIESKWEKDSTTNLRFARLNLVDLAGSERQKTSGAEGERLKEAANINKSLSTLGFILIPHPVPQLVLHFLVLMQCPPPNTMQDSLGGNSKTMIIANVSPSICCAAETLNTLKFGQRAKLIQNNAVVNEDATGDVIALQHQIRLLKEELFFLKHQNISRSLSFGSITVDNMQAQENACVENIYELDQQEVDNSLGYESKGVVRMSTKQLKSLETTLAGSLRREQMAETSIKKLEAEIEQLNRLVRQREEDTRGTKMMLRFREDKIQRMELLLGGSLPADSFLLEENRALSEQIQLLQSKIDRNPEVTRFALENIRLLEQLRRFQEFYEEGEREILLAEVSKLRDQLLQFLDGNSKLHNDETLEIKPQEAVSISKENDSLQLELKNTLGELNDCKQKLNSCLEDNAKLNREIHDLQSTLKDFNSASYGQDKESGNIKSSLGAPTFEMDEMDSTQMMKHAEEIMDLQLELDILKIILKEERASHTELEKRQKCFNGDLQLAKDQLLLMSKQYEDTYNELNEAKSVIEALESQQILSINEMEDLQQNNNHYVKQLREQELEINALKEKLSSKELRNLPSSNHCRSEGLKLEAQFRRMHDSLDKAKRMNIWYQSDRDFHVSNEAEMDEVRRQAEAETAEVIVCMQEELTTLQQAVHDCYLKEMETKNSTKLLETDLKELQEKLNQMTESNQWLLHKLEEKDGELRTLKEEWELLGSEVEEVLTQGHETLIDASDQLDLISCSFPQKRIWVSEQVGRLIRIISEKEILIEELGRCLEDANSKRSEVEYMLKSLRGAALVINEAHQQECIEKEEEVLLLKSELSERTSTTAELENRMKLAEKHIHKMSVCATAAFVIIGRFSETTANHLNALKEKDLQFKQVAEANLKKDAILDDQAAVIEESEKQIQCLQKELVELKENCTELGQKPYEQRNCYMEKKLEDIEESDLLQTREKLNELKAGVSALRSCIGLNVEHNYRPESHNTERDTSCDGTAEGRLDAETNKSVDVHFVDDKKTEFSDCSSRARKSLCDYSCKQKQMESGKIFDDMHKKDVTIALLKREIESAIESLKEVQAEMAKLQYEKEKMLMSEKQYEKNMKNLTTEVLTLQAAINEFQKQSELKIEAITHKVEAVEHIVQEAGTYWYETKETLELEVGDAKMVAAQKAAEASCVFSKFEEAQDTMKEADILINGLMIAKETMKLDIIKLKQMEVTLNKERDMLLNEVQRLQTINDLKDHQFKNLENQFGTDLMETRESVVELEGMIADLQTTFDEKLMPIAHDFQGMKSLISDSTKLMRSWLEDIWSEIVAKDCGMAVLHLCHMGILLETVAGVNAENSLLEHGLCESNSVIADLREHNLKSRKELEMCRDIKGKLLADIKRSFDQVSRKEEEAGELCAKLITFEKRISDLQLQEELMFERFNQMGSQLAILMKEMDLSNRNIVASLLDQEKQRKDNEDVLKSEADFLMLDSSSKSFESLVLALKLEEMALQKAESERINIICCAVIESLKKQMIFSKVDAGLMEQLLMDNDVDLTFLQKEVEEAQRDKDGMLSELEQSRLRTTQLDIANKALEEEIQSLKEVAFSNNMLRSQLGEVMETKITLSSQVQALESECHKLQNDLRMKEAELESSSSNIASLYQQNQKLRKDISLLESAICNLKNDLAMKDTKLSRMGSLEEHNESLKSEVRKLETVNNLILQDLEEKKSEFESSLSRIHISDIENKRLQDKVLSLESCIDNLETDLKTKMAELDELQHSQSVMMEDVSSKGQDLEIFSNRVNTLREENISLTKSLSTASLNILKCVDSVKAMDRKGGKLFNKINEEGFTILDNLFQVINENEERISKLMNDFECLECHVEELVYENKNLRSEISRKDDVLEGLKFDLSLLQESASSTKDQKDEIEEMVASIEALEDDLALKSSELVEAVTHSQMLEAQLQEKLNVISTLQSDISRQQETLKLLSGENLELRAVIEDTLAAKSSVQEELAKRMNKTKSLEMELREMSNALGQMNGTIESLRKNLIDLTGERDYLHMEVLKLNEMLEREQARAEENEATAIEVHQLAESRKTYAEEKEAEVKLLERSVEELECTINVLENKVDIVKGEAERQRLQREELEMELHTVKHQMQNVGNVDADMKSHLEQKEKNLQQAHKQIQLLERDISEKAAEISQCKAHISELNLHAEAQASEYKQKFFDINKFLYQFKALEAMAEQVRPESHSSHVTCSSSNKIERNASKPRGSGSPFKCIGLGLAQQLKLEKDEEITAARLRIEELEHLAVNRQKEIFSLNARLAAAESMTHDVIRDLLGVKLDMTNYVSLLDNQQVQKIAEKARLSNVESQVKDQEMIKLKQQLNEFVEERQGWLEEIERKQAEMVAAQIALEKLRQRDQMLKTENEMLKEENNMLKIQNQDLGARLRRTEVNLSRAREELAQYRASVGKNPYIDFDAEERLNNQLKEAEEERMQLAQKLIGLCTSVLKACAAGITKPVADINPAVAEEALEQLESRAASQERELQDLKLKSRLNDERNRLSEMMTQVSPINLRTDENCQTPRRLSQAPYLSGLDR
ncbi:kinesin-like protein KIN-12D [Citrus sinensis]|uniref:Kinesin-like protein KIN-12D n=1 Tax=Citrus sinensis TaxID=2711 RepID=A0ACB8IFD0_CITSI|nr:kinesin-like protein KIN-12D [Citrus sinensis]